MLRTVDCGWTDGSLDVIKMGTRMRVKNLVRIGLLMVLRRGRVG